MKMTNEEYSDYVDSLAPKSTLSKNMVNAFWVGGLICCVGEAFGDLYKWMGLKEDLVPVTISITMIFIGALLTGLNVYDNIAKVGGAGTLVPITGFSNSIVSPAMEFRCEGFITGMSAKMFQIAGPVLVFGITASIALGIIYKLFVF